MTREQKFVAKGFSEWLNILIDVFFCLGAATAAERRLAAATWLEELAARMRVKIPEGTQCPSRR